MHLILTFSFKAFLENIQLKTSNLPKCASTYFNITIASTWRCTLFCMLWPVFGCCALQTLVEICFFMILAWCKKTEERKKKQENLDKILKKCVIFSLQRNAFWGYYSQKNTFTDTKRYKKMQKDAMRLKVATFHNLCVFSGNKTLNQLLCAN